jgi:hypothetical protein
MDCLGGFPGRVESETLRPMASEPVSPLMTPWIYLRDPAYTDPSGLPSPDSPILLRRPFVVTSIRWGRNVDLLSIGYAFRPHLRTRLTLSGLTLLRKP